MGNVAEPQKAQPQVRTRHAVLRVARYYALFSSLWIIGSDLTVFFRGGVTIEDTLIGISKGLLFVVTTTILIHLYMVRALRSSESERAMLQRRLQEWSSHANDIILLFDEQARVLEANERAVQSYGYSAEELVGKRLDELVADVQALQERWQRLLAVGEARAKTFHRRADGTIFPAEFSSKRIETPDGVLVQTIIRDISESEEARLQIIRLKDLYAALSQTNHCIAVARDQQELFEATCEIAVRYGHFKMAWVGLLNEEEKTILPVAHAGGVREYLQDLKISFDPESPLSRGPGGRAVLERRPVLLCDLPDSDLVIWRERLQMHGLGSIACFPLFRRGQVVGMLALYSEIAGYFQPDLTNLLEEMAKEISAALDRMADTQDRQQLAADLAESHAWIKGIIEESPDFIAAINRDMVLTLYNRSYGELVGQSGTQRRIGAQIGQDPRLLFSAWHQALTGEPVQKEWTLNEGEQRRHFESRFAPLYDHDRQLIGAFHIGRDITEHKRMEMELRKLMTAIEQSPVTVMITDCEGSIQYVNPAFTATSGYTASEAIGLRPSLLHSGETSATATAAMWECLQRGEAWAGEFHNKRKDGTLYWEEAVIAPVRDQMGRTVQYIAVKQDVTLRREAEEHARFLASYDSLTRLPNRVVGRSRMEQAMTEARAARRKVALMFLDVDHFKRINDSLGHELGDQLLLAQVERLKGCLGKTDTLYRLGGDEFMIILPDLEGSSAALRMVESIRQQTAMPFHVQGFELSATFSIGIAMYPDDGSSFEELYRHADLAMDSAKHDGRNTSRMFTRRLEAEAQEYLQILNGLRKALERREFELYYQPQIEITTGRVTGAEALIRWRHPELGMIAPGRFIPVAEDSGLIVDIGKWVIEECCRQAAQWRAAGFEQLVVAANVSVLQFRRGRLDLVVAEALKQTGLSPHQLELEVTESVLAEDQSNVAALLKRLHDLGVSLALDDFGTGYSSFAYLSQFKLDKLKIDQTFVRNISSNRNDEAIVCSIVGLAKTFGLQTVAEGVETEQALEMIRRAGCDQAQGYLYAKPMPAAEFVQYLQARQMAQPSLF